MKKLLILILSFLFFYNIEIFSYQLINNTFKPGQQKLTGIKNKDLDQPIIVKLTDKEGKPVINEPIYFSIYKTPSKANGHNLSDTIVYTDTNGIAQTYFKLGDKEGNYLLLISSKLTPQKNIILEIESLSKWWITITIVALLGGLALFLYGMDLMGKGLTKYGGAQLSGILRKLTANRFLGVIVGAIVTAIIQSSSATTVIVVGFINAGLMTLSQSIGIILGANIGTTITAQIVAFKLTDYALLFIAIGFAFLFIGKENRTKYIGEIILGFGILFYGIKIMGEVMEPFRYYQPFIEYMHSLENPVTGILVGMIFTAIIQSSSAATGVFIALAFQGMLTLKAAIPLTFGANIGTCVTAMLASMNANREAKRAALAHILFNVLSTIIFFPFFDHYERLIEYISFNGIHALNPQDIANYVPRQIAHAHSIAKIIAVILFLPFTNILAKFCIWILPYNKNEKKVTTKFLDEKVLLFPETALSLSKREIIRVAFSTKKMFDNAMIAIETKDIELINQVIKYDDKIDYLEDIIKRYLMQIGKTQLTEQQAKMQISYLYITEHIEHIADIIYKEMMKLIQKMIDKKIKFYSKDLKNLMEYHKLTEQIFQKLFTEWEKENLSVVDEIISLKNQSIKLENTIKKEHYNYIFENIQEALDTDSIVLDLINCYRQINSKLASIAFILKGDL